MYPKLLLPLLLGPMALASGFKDGLNEAMTHGHPNPLLSGAPVEVEAPAPADSQMAGCDRRAEPDRATLRITTEQICFSREWTRVTLASARDPEPTRPSTWFETDEGESQHAEPEGELDRFADCRTSSEHTTIWRERTEICAPNAGLVTEETRTLRLVQASPLPGIGKISPHRAAWTVALTKP